jgi:hypothetical protein
MNLINEHSDKIDSRQKSPCPSDLSFLDIKQYAAPVYRKFDEIVGKVRRAHKFFSSLSDKIIHSKKSASHSRSQKFVR